MRLIDADALIQNAESLLYKGNRMSEFVKNMADNAPTIDAEPVVRCGDCLFCQMELCEGADEPWCDIHNTTVDTEMFCSWGIRKNNE